MISRPIDYSDYWLELRVDAGGGEVVTLEPRQRVVIPRTSLEGGAAPGASGLGTSETDAASAGRGLRAAERDRGRAAVVAETAAMNIAPSGGAGTGPGAPFAPVWAPDSPCPTDWQVSGSALYYLCGNIGIGTQAPVYPLTVIGQEALARTLKNAVTSGRIAHAFLFTGIRGVGKTIRITDIHVHYDLAVPADAGEATRRALGPPTGTPSRSSRGRRCRRRRPRPPERTRGRAGRRRRSEGSGPASDKVRLRPGRRAGRRGRASTS